MFAAAAISLITALQSHLDPPSPLRVSRSGPQADLQLSVCLSKVQQRLSAWITAELLSGRWSLQRCRSCRGPDANSCRVLCFLLVSPADPEARVCVFRESCELQVGHMMQRSADFSQFFPNRHKQENEEQPAFLRQPFSLPLFLLEASDGAAASP